MNWIALMLVEVAFIEFLLVILLFALAKRRRGNSRYYREIKEIVSVKPQVKEFKEEKEVKKVKKVRKKVFREFFLRLYIRTKVKLGSFFSKVIHMPYKVFSFIASKFKRKPKAKDKDLEEFDVYTKGKSRRRAFFQILILLIVILGLGYLLYRYVDGTYGWALLNYIKDFIYAVGIYLYNHAFYVSLVLLAIFVWFFAIREGRQ